MEEMGIPMTLKQIRNITKKMEKRRIDSPSSNEEIKIKK